MEPATWSAATVQMTDMMMPMTSQGHVLTRGGHAGDGQDDDAGRSRQADADAAEPGADDNEQ